MSGVSAVESGLRRALSSLGRFSKDVIGKELRPYQLEAGEAIVEAVRAQDARTITVLMSRQAGKNELSAHVEAYLMTLRAERGGTIVKASPTFDPQAHNSMKRLREVLRNPLAEVRETESRHGYVVSRGKAETYFLSAEPDSHIVGATASLMLEVDEAQDVEIEKHDRELAPMCASTAAPRVYYGTAGREDDLLQRMVARNLKLQAADGVRRHFAYPWQVVAEQIPLYGLYVRAQIAELGPEHPAILSQYELKPVAPVGALFSQRKLDLLKGSHPRLAGPREGRTYVAGVDIAGGGGRAFEEGYDGDSTVVTIAEIVEREEGQPPPAALGRSLRVVEIVEIRGESHMAQHAELVQLLNEKWQCKKVAFDATGAGAMPCEALVKVLGQWVVMPFVFTSTSKSTLGYDLLAAIDGGRLTMWAAGAEDRESNAFWGQVRNTRRIIRSEEQLGWEARSGHDDYVSSLALCFNAGEAYREYVPSVIIERPLYGADDKDVF